MSSWDVAVDLGAALALMQLVEVAAVAASVAAAVAQEAAAAPFRLLCPTQLASSMQYGRSASRRAVVVVHTCIGRHGRVPAVELAG